MSKRQIWFWTALTALVMVVSPGVGVALAGGEQEVEKVKRIRIEKTHECEHEGECDHGEKVVRKVFINRDGETTELTGDEAAAWVEAEGGGDHVIVRHMGGMHGKRTYLGVGLTELTPELQAHYGAPDGTGVLVGKVMDGSPAARAGVAVGDVITAVGDKSVGSAQALSRAIQKAAAGETVVVHVVRNGKAETLSAALEEREGPMMMGGPKMHMHGGPHGPHGMRRVEVRCKASDGGEEDCEVEMGDAVGELADFDCGSETCEVRVECEDDGCECTINGDAADCNDIPGFAERHGD